MGRPSKSLAERVRDTSSLARRHAPLLAGRLVAREDLRRIQTAYQAATTERERRAIALDFQEQVTREKMAALGDRSSVDPTLTVADFFAANLIHQKGPAAGQAFVLEPWQREFVEELYRLDERGQRI